MNRSLQLHTQQGAGLSPRPIYRLQGGVKNFDWGSYDLLAEFQGREPSALPEAEQWWGTHRDAHTLVNTDQGVVELAEITELPYLVKLLAAEKPLSIQAHPNLEQAAEGFARENQAGIELSDPERSYKDANHKAEMLVALTSFTAYCGFRPAADSARSFQRLVQVLSAFLDGDRPEILRGLTAVCEALDHGDLKTAFTAIIDPDGPWHGWTRTIVQALKHSPTVIDSDPYLHGITTLASYFDDDAGTISTVLLNRVELVPGQALFLVPGTIHAYVEGLGLEVMATSDNVVRGGLTVKHIDVAELTKVVDFSPTPVPYIEPEVAGNTAIFAPNIPDFQLTQFHLTAHEEHAFTSQRSLIVLCTEGSGRFESDGTLIEVSRGDGVFIPAGETQIQAIAEDSGFTVFAAQAGC